jgi:hypothetical protein
MEIPFVAPTHQKYGFNCPYCKAYAEQTWFDVAYGQSDPGRFHAFLSNYEISICSRCNKVATSIANTMIFPPVSSAPMPSADMPEDVKADFSEARNIVGRSPRAACALLRLAVQKLMVALGEKGKDLNDDIKNLVAKGLPTKLQKALDSVRVIGNEAVHPGTLDLKDDAATANAIFSLVNTVVDIMVTQPKEIDEIYSKLPESKKEAIAKRDGK